MKQSLLVLILLVTVPRVVSAQWQKRIGINVIPLAIRTIELTSEFTNHPAYALTFNAGYVHESAFDGLVKSKVYDGVSDRRTSGLFVKAGFRTYLLSLTGKEPAFNLFVGAQLIGSQYRQRGIVSAIDPGFYVGGAPPDVAVRVSGFLWGTALSGGATVRLSQKLAFDVGIQYGLQPTRTDYIGDREFNYQPGFGISRAGGTVTSVQGILTVKYRL